MKDKRLINVIYSLNIGWYFITAFLFVTIYLGLVAEILLGFIQVLSSILLLFYWGSLSIKQKRKIYLYWLIVVFYFSLWFLYLVFIGLFQ